MSADWESCISIYTQHAAVELCVSLVTHAAPFNINFLRLLLHVHVHGIQCSSKCSAMCVLLMVCSSSVEAAI